MRTRLFWKILLSFCLVFILIFEITWLFFAPSKENHPERIWQHNREMAFAPQPQLLIRVKGEHLSLVQNRVMQLAVPDTTVKPFLSDFPDEGLSPPERLGEVFNIPIPLLLLGLFVGLVFSWLCAWSIAKPVSLLQKGFSRIEQGDLSIRLYDKLKSRHDELSSLAYGFDNMVKKLNDYQSARQFLLHDISHELRTPLTRLQLAIELAEDDSANIQNSLQRIATESKRLDRLIGEILNYTRLESAGKSESYFDIDRLLHTIIDDANYELQTQSGTRICYTVEQTPHTIIHGHVESIRSAFENIIRNAIRFTPQGKDIFIVLAEAGKSIVVIISDQGIGVEHDKLPYIFEPFMRIQSAMMGKGYGLGLAIAKKAILANKGTITAKNGEPNGLIITVTLPFWDEEALDN